MADEKPVIAQKAPYKVTAKADEKYFWCACGRSKKQPFCDGSHKGTSFAPVMRAETKDGDIWLCGCKATKNPPYCDSTHNRI